MVHRRDLALISGVLFLSTVGYGLTLPALPFFVERLALGPSPARAAVALHVGLLTSAYALSQLLSAPLAGTLSDRLGRRALLLAGLVCFTVAQIVFGLGTSLPVLYSARLLGGVGAGAMYTVTNAFVVDALPRPERARGLAWTGTVASLGVVVGPAMSGLLSRGNMHGHAMIGGLMLDGFSIPFLAAGGLGVAAIVVTLTLIQFPPPAAAKSLVRGDDRNASLAALLGLTAIAQLALSSFEAVFALYGQDVLGAAIGEIGLGFVVCGGVMALQGVIVGLLEGRVPLRGQVAMGFLVLGIGVAVVGSTTTIASALGAIAILAVGMALVAPNVAAAVAEARPRALGTAFGYQATAAGLGRVVGPVVGSLLYSVRPGLPFWVMGSIATGTAMVWAFAGATPRER